MSEQTATCTDIEILEGENLEILKWLKAGTFSLIYIDPPFNTKKKQKRNELAYEDSFADYNSFIVPRLIEAKRLLTPNGSLFFHIDQRESHYVKIELDKIFGRKSFMNEIIWSYDYGARQKTKWPTKHDSIFWYVNDPENYIYNYDAIDRIPYQSTLCGPEKFAKGKTPTDVWTMTIVPTNSKEKTGYPTQKPLHLINRIVKVHSNRGDLCLDFFAGSGTFGMSCSNLGRKCVLIDNNPQAIDVMKKRMQIS